MTLHYSVRAALCVADAAAVALRAVDPGLDRPQGRAAAPGAARLVYVVVRNIQTAAWLAYDRVEHCKRCPVSP